MAASFYYFFSILKLRGTLQFLAILVIQMLGVFAEMLPLLIIMPLIRTVVRPGAGIGSAGRILPDPVRDQINDFITNTEIFDQMVILVVAATIAQILQGILNGFIANLTDLFLTRKKVALARELFGNFLIHGHGKLQKGNPLRVIQMGCSALSEVSEEIVKIARGFFLLFIVAAILIYLFPLPSSFGIGSMLILALVINFIVTPYFKRIGKQREREEIETRDSLEDRFQALKELKLLGRGEHISHHFVETTEKEARSARTLNVASTAVQTLNSSLHYGSLLVGFLAAIWGGYPTERVGSFLLVYALAMLKASAALRMFVNSSILVVSKHGSLLQSHNMVKELRGTEVRRSDSKVELKKSIKLENVSFSYPNSTANAVENLNMTINKGDLVALVGKNGSGKSTLVDLLTMYHQPSEGKLLVDGVPIAAEHVNSWQEEIGYLIQRPHVIDDTILQNVIIGMDEDHVDIDRLMQVVQVTKLDEVIENLPDGLHTKVGSRGGKLSGGQAQRVSMARALYRDSHVLILDEATKAMDPATEKEIIENIMQHWKDKSIVMITHSMETLKYANRIYVMDQGKIAGCGTFAQLSATNPAFRQLMGEQNAQPAAVPAALTN